MDGKDLKCSNCETQITPLWRKRGDGTYLCNACGLYRKIHGMDRPKEMKTDVVRHRRRSQKNMINWRENVEMFNESQQSSEDSKCSNSSLLQEYGSNSETENICISDKGDKKAINKKIQEKKKKKEVMHKSRDQIKKSNGDIATESDDTNQSDLSYDDNFDYTILTNLKNYRKQKSSSMSKTKNNSKKQKKNKEIEQLIVNTCTEAEIIALEGLIKLSKTK